MTLLIHDRIMSDVEENDIEFLELSFKQILQIEVDTQALTSDERTTSIIKRLHTVYKECVKKQQTSKTSLLWLQYLDMLNILLSYLRCERIGDFEGSLWYLQEMLPYIASTGHNLYTTDLWLYLQLITELKNESPEDYKKFKDGYAVIRRTNKRFGGIPSDQIIEQLLMRGLKTRGGLSRGRGFTEVQQAVWLFSRNSCAEVNLALQNDLLNMNHSTSAQHVVMGKTSLKKNEQDYVNTLEFLKSRKVFDKSREPLENLVTGLEADPSVNIYLAKEVGNSIINNIIGQSVKTFSFKRKNQAITMGTKIKRKDGTILQINAQNLFDRLISMALVCVIYMKYSAMS
jgi:hypothetical protein